LKLCRSLPPKSGGERCAVFAGGTSWTLVVNSLISPVLGVTLLSVVLPSVEVAA
jgi:hypothetical protein